MTPACLFFTWKEVRDILFSWYSAVKSFALIAFLHPHLYHFHVPERTFSSYFQCWFSKIMSDSSDSRLSMWNPKKAGLPNIRSCCCNLCYAPAEICFAYYDSGSYRAMQAISRLLFSPFWSQKYQVLLLHLFSHLMLAFERDSRKEPPHFSSSDYITVITVMQWPAQWASTERLAVFENYLQLLPYLCRSMVKHFKPHFFQNIQLEFFSSWIGSHIVKPIAVHKKIVKMLWNDGRNCSNVQQGLYMIP